MLGWSRGGHGYMGAETGGGRRRSLLLLCQGSNNSGKKVHMALSFSRGQRSLRSKKNPAEKYNARDPLVVTDPSPPSPLALQTTPSPHLGTFQASTHLPPS